MTKAVHVILHAVCAAALVHAQGPSIRVVHDPAKVPERTVRAVEELLPERLAGLTTRFPGAPARPFSVHLHAGPTSLPDPVRSHLHPGTPGLALLDRDQIHLLLDRIRSRRPNDLTTVLDHELVHVLLHHFAGDAAPFVPRWFHEGLAQHLSGDTYLGASEEDLFYDAQTDNLIRFVDLRSSFPPDAAGRRKAYAQSFSFVDFLVRELGERTIIETARDCDGEEWYRGAFVRRTAVPLGIYQKQWIEYLRNDSGARYRILFRNCFSYLMILAFVLLALAGARRWNRDLRVRRKLEREDAEEDAESRSP